MPIPQLQVARQTPTHRLSVLLQLDVLDITPTLRAPTPTQHARVPLFHAVGLQARLEPVDPVDVMIGLVLDALVGGVSGAWLVAGWAWVVTFAV